MLKVSFRRSRRSKTAGYRGNATRHLGLTFRQTIVSVGARA